MARNGGNVKQNNTLQSNENQTVDSVTKVGALQFSGNDTIGHIVKTK